MPPTSKRRKPQLKQSHRQNVKTSRGLVRIIAGKHRGRRLPVLVHEGLRPTGDRVKETLFNWLMNDIPQAICLDMFAGSGALGIEALSRGANYVMFVENEKRAAQQISSNLNTLGETSNAEVIQKSALENSSTLSPQQHNQFDVVFIDPPFGKNMIEQSLTKLTTKHLLANNALVYIESAHADEYELPTEFNLHKQTKTSQVLASLYVYKNPNI